MGTQRHDDLPDGERTKSLDRIGKTARGVAIAAAIVWLAAVLFLPRDVPEAVASWWNGVLLVLVCVGLTVWSLVSLSTRGHAPSQ
ncbi:hypothetical protein [Microbacterium arborescens]